MRAAVFYAPGDLRIEDHEDPKIEAPDDVIIEVEGCGICGTDLQIMSDPPGHPATPGVILGHEFVGRVVAMGPSVRALPVGQRVVVDPDPKCGACHYCRTGRPANCSNVVALGSFANGALAQYTKAPASSVYPISDDLPVPVAALVEPLACVVNGTNRTVPRPGESAVVFGAGAIGCLFTALLGAAGARPIIVVEPSPGRRSVAASVGADHVLTPEEFAEQREQLLPLGAEILVDAMGGAFATAVDHAARGARILLFGQNANVRAPIKQYTITERSLTVLGSYITTFTFPTAIRLAEQGTLPLAAIVSRVMGLDETLEGLALLRSGSATKVCITPNS